MKNRLWDVPESQDLQDIQCEIDELIDLQSTALSVTLIPCQFKRSKPAKVVAELSDESPRKTDAVARIDIRDVQWNF